MIVRKFLGYVWSLVLHTFYKPILLLGYKNNIWNLYDSYHMRGTKGWKQQVWNTYMRKNAASISIDAKFASRPILPHGVSGIFITQSAIIGRNAVIFQQVTIGANTIFGSKSYGAPTIGDNVYIGAGAKIIGSANIHNNVRIGANAVVTQHIPSNSIVVSEKVRIIQSDKELNNTFQPYLSN
jgi:serine O-acetyltransferase